MRLELTKYAIICYLNSRNVQFFFYILKILRGGGGSYKLRYELTSDLQCTLYTVNALL